jgi:hypothetical protein
MLKARQTLMDESLLQAHFFFHADIILGCVSAATATAAM